MSQPPTLFPKSPLGSGQNSGTASTGSATSATPADQRPRLGTPATPGTAPVPPRFGTPATPGTAPAVPPRPATPTPASPFKSAAPPLGTPAQPAGAAPAGSAFRPTTPTGTGLGGTGLGGTPAGAARPPLGQSGLAQTGLGQSALGTPRPPLGSTLPPRTGCPIPTAGGMAAPRPAQAQPGQAVGQSADALFQIPVGVTHLVPVDDFLIRMLGQGRVEQVLDEQDRLDVLLAVHAPAVLSLDRADVPEFRLPVPQDVRLDLDDVAHIADRIVQAHRKIGDVHAGRPFPARRRA